VRAVGEEEKGRRRENRDSRNNRRRGRLEWWITHEGEKEKGTKLRGERWDGEGRKRGGAAWKGYLQFNSG